MAHISNFEQAVALDTQAWLNTLPREVPAYAFSAPYLKFIARLTDKMRCDKYHRFTKKATAFIIIAAILLSLAVITVASTAGKEFIIRHFGGFAQAEIVDTKQADAVTDFALNYIPPGFLKSAEDKSEFGFSYTYENGKQWFSINKSKLDSQTLISENTGLEVIQSDYQKYYVNRSDEANTMMWNNGKYVYDITGNISVETLLKIAQGAR